MTDRSVWTGPGAREPGCAAGWTGSGRQLPPAVIAEVSPGLGPLGGRGTARIESRFAFEPAHTLYRHP